MPGRGSLAVMAREVWSGCVTVTIHAPSAMVLAQYATIPIAFEVTEVFDVASSAERAGAYVLTAGGVPTPYVKDYDALPGEEPRNWPRSFDISRWGMFLAGLDGRLVGAAAVAYGTAGVEMLEGRSDLAVLWNIRVAPALRHRRVGAALFNAAEAWAVSKGCGQLKVETQNTNVPACRFYARQGCVLRTVKAGVYRAFPGGVQLFWYKDLSA